MKTKINIKSHYGTMKKIHLVMDLDKLAELFQKIEYDEIQSVVDDDNERVRYGDNPQFFTASQLRKLNSTLGTDFYDKIELPDDICGYDVKKYYGAWYCLGGGDMVECENQEDVYYLIYELISRNFDLCEISKDEISEAKEHFYLLREGNDYENADIKKMYAIVDRPEPNVMHTKGYLLLDSDWDVEF